MCNLSDIIRKKVADAWGDQIRRENSFHSHAVLSDYEIDAWIDRQSTSWLMDEISNALCELNTKPQ